MRLTEHFSSCRGFIVSVGSVSIFLSSSLQSRRSATAGQIPYFSVTKRDTLMLAPSCGQFEPINLVAFPKNVGTGGHVLTSIRSESMFLGKINVNNYKRMNNG